jgi:hypothetical protein
MREDSSSFSLFLHPFPLFHLFALHLRRYFLGKLAFRSVTKELKQSNITENKCQLKLNTLFRHQLIMSV